MTLATDLRPPTDHHRPAPVLALPGGPPSVRLCAAPDAAPVAAAIRDALDLLVAAGRIRWADRAGRADLLHTVGNGADGADGAAHQVHTVHRIPLWGPNPTAARRWVLRERHWHVRGTVWLIHGRTAARMVVEAGLAAGERATPAGAPAVPTRPRCRARRPRSRPARRAAARAGSGRASGSSSA